METFNVRNFPRVVHSASRQQQARAEARSSSHTEELPFKVMQSFMRPDCVSVVSYLITLEYG